MVEWLAGNRIKGTSTERTAGTPAVPADITQGGWKELARTTLGSVGDTISVASLPEKTYYMVLGDVKASGYIIYNSRFNSDTGNNYASRKSNNGGADATSTSTSRIDQTDSGAQVGSFVVGYFTGKSDKTKLWQGNTAENSATGANNAPARVEAVGKWENTSNAVSSYQAYNSHSGDYAVGSEVVVLGWDPADTHTTNFWEQLASVELSSAGDTLSSGTFTAKKYLWCQVYIKPTGTVDIDVTFNNDTGSNYARRNNYNGGTDSTNTIQSNLQWSNNVTVPQFMNCFIINNSATEKLSIMEQVRQGTAGAGTAPDRYHISGKWANTSSQITEIDITNGESGSYDTESFIKVWGSN